MKRTCCLLLALLLLCTGCGSDEPQPNPPPTEEAPAAVEPTTAVPSVTAAPTAVAPTAAAPDESQASVATAMGWFPVAEEIASAWQADAVLTSINGNSNGIYAGALPCDGTSDIWGYEFVSVATRTGLSISVRGGEVVRQRERELTRLGKPYTDDDMLWITDLYPTTDWAVDSARAVSLANELFREKHGQEPTGAAYVLFNGKAMDMVNNSLSNWMRWVISYDPEGPSMQVDIDARTGEVTE